MAIFQMPTVRPRGLPPIARTLRRRAPGRRPPGQEGPFAPRRPFDVGENPEEQGAFGGRTAADFARTDALERQFQIENKLGFGVRPVQPGLPLPQRRLGTAGEPIPGAFSETGEQVLRANNVFTTEPEEPRRIQGLVNAAGKTVTREQILVGYQKYLDAFERRMESYRRAAAAWRKQWRDASADDRKALEALRPVAPVKLEQDDWADREGYSWGEIENPEYKRIEEEELTKKDREFRKEGILPPGLAKEKPEKPTFDQPETYRTIPHPQDTRFHILQRVQKKADGSWDIQNIRTEETPEAKKERIEEWQRQRALGYKPGLSDVGLPIEWKRGAAQTGAIAAQAAQFAPATQEAASERAFQGAVRGGFAGTGFTSAAAPSPSTVAGGYDPNAPFGSPVNPYGSPVRQGDPALAQNMLNAQQANNQVMVARTRQALYPAAQNAIKLLQGNPQALRDDQKAALLRRNPDGSFEGSLAPLFEAGVEEAQGLDLSALWAALQPLRGFGFARPQAAIFAGRR